MSTSTPVDRRRTISATKLGSLSLKDFSSRVDWLGVRVADSTDCTPWVLLEDSQESAHSHPTKSVESTARTVAPESQTPVPETRVAATEIVQPESKSAVVLLADDKLDELTNSSTSAESTNQSKSPGLESVESVSADELATAQQAEVAQAADLAEKKRIELEQEQAAKAQNASEQQAAEQRAAEQRAAEQRAAEQQAAEQQAAEQQAAEQQAAEQQAAEQQAAEQRAAEQQAAQQRAAEERAAEQRAAEQRAAEQRAAQQQAAEQRAADRQAKEIAKQEQAAAAEAEAAQAKLVVRAEQARRASEHQSTAADQVAVGLVKANEVAQPSVAKTEPPELSDARPSYTPSITSPPPSLPPARHRAVKKEHESDYLKDLECLVLQLHFDLARAASGSDMEAETQSQLLARRVLDLSLENMQLRRQLANLPTS